MAYTCSVCGASRSERIPPLGLDLTMSGLLENMTGILTACLGWTGVVADGIAENPIFLLIVVTGFIGSGVVLFRRILPGSSANRTSIGHKSRRCLSSIDPLRLFPRTPDRCLQQCPYYRRVPAGRESGYRQLHDTYGVQICDLLRLFVHAHTAADTPGHDAEGDQGPADYGTSILVFPAPARPPSPLI